jgi:hypothetical protein
MSTAYGRQNTIGVQGWKRTLLPGKIRKDNGGHIDWALKDILKWQMIYSREGKYE